jgi:hypothetical protein
MAAAPRTSATALAHQHVLLERFDAATASMVAGATPVTPSAQATVFYDATVGRPVPDAALQTALEAVVDRAPYRAVKAHLGISLVDLSAARFSPKYAGVNDTTNFYAASTAKVCGLLAAYQLLADANAFLAANPATADMPALEAALAAEYTRLGVSKERPAVGLVLQFHAGAPPTVTLRSELAARFDDISHGNENGSTAIVLLRFPFVASTMLAHGLFSAATRSGLWVNKAYGPIRYPSSGDPARSVANWTSAENPFPSAPVHCVTAVTIAQFFTLAAQGRLIDAATSQAILRHLRLDLGGCASTEPDLTALQAAGVVAAKCGIYGDVLHVPLHYRDSTSSREFVVVILTRNDTYGVVKSLFADLVALV